VLIAEAFSDKVFITRSPSVCNFNRFKNVMYLKAMQIKSKHEKYVSRPLQS